MMRGLGQGETKRLPSHGETMEAYKLIEEYEQRMQDEASAGSKFMCQKRIAQSVRACRRPYRRIAYPPLPPPPPPTAPPPPRWAAGPPPPPPPPPAAGLGATALAPEVQVRARWPFWVGLAAGVTGIVLLRYYKKPVKVGPVKV